MAAVPSPRRPLRADAAPAAEAVATQDLYERYARQIFGYCFHQLGSREEAEDAVQSTFLNAFRGLRRGIVPEAESAWLFKIAQNVCLSRRRSSWRRGRVESPADFELVEEQTPAPSRRADELIGLQDVLEQMPENQRRAILLREWQGLSYREIAEELELSQAAVETLIFRARRSLAQGLETPPEPVRARVRRGADLGNVLAGLKTLLLGGGATATKVAATVAIVSASTVAVATPVEQHASHQRQPVGPAKAPAAAVTVATPPPVAPASPRPSSAPTVGSTIPFSFRRDARVVAPAVQGAPAPPARLGEPVTETPAPVETQTQTQAQGQTQSQAPASPQTSSQNQAPASQFGAEPQHVAAAPPPPAATPPAPAAAEQPRRDRTGHGSGNGAAAGGSTKGDHAIPLGLPWGPVSLPPALAKPPTRFAPGDRGSGQQDGGPGSGSNGSRGFAPPSRAQPAPSVFADGGSGQQDGGRGSGRTGSPGVSLPGAAQAGPSVGTVSSRGGQNGQNGAPGGDGSNEGQWGGQAQQAAPQQPQGSRPPQGSQPPSGQDTTQGPVTTTSIAVAPAPSQSAPAPTRASAAAPVVPGSATPRDQGGDTGAAGRDSSRGDHSSWRGMSSRGDGGNG